jgi:hypothetical protein
MLFKIKKEWMLVIGVFSLIVANLLKFFGGYFLTTDFLEGMFTGISLVMNFCYLIRFSLEKRLRSTLS